MMKYGKIKIDVSIGFIMLISLVLLIDRHNLFFYSCAAAVLHELGHLAAAALINAKVAEINLRAFGAEIKLCRSIEISYLGEAFIRAAGPFAGFVSAAIFSPMGFIFEYKPFFMLAGMNFIIAAVNLIPAGRSDGGLVVYYIVCRCFGPAAAETTLRICTAVCGMLLVLSGAAVLSVTGRNVTLLAFGVFLICDAFLRDFGQKGRRDVKKCVKNMMK